MKKKKWYQSFWFYSLLVIGLLGGYFYTRPNESKKEEQVETFVLKKSDFKQVYQSVSKISSKHSQQVGNQVNAPIQAIHVKLGDHVKKGDLLVSFDESEMNKQEESLKQTAAKLQQSQQSQNQLLEKGFSFLEKGAEGLDLSQVSSFANMQQAKDSLASMMAQQSESSTMLLNQQLQSIQTLKQDYKVKADFDGVVTYRNVDGSVNMQGILLQVDDVNHLVATIDVDEYNVISLKDGMKVKLVAQATKKEYEGKISNISHIPSPQGGYPVEISFENEEPDLFLGMSLKVEVIQKEEKDVYVVPLDAIGSDQDGKDIIYVSSEDGFKTIPVEKKVSNDYEVVIVGDDLKDDLLIARFASQAKDHFKDDAHE